MYAVVASGGKQYMVKTGMLVRIESVVGKVGSEFEFNDVLMYSNGEKVDIGRPYLEDTIVKGRIVSHGRGKKIIVFKYKRRKRYRRKNGHRQNYTDVLIKDIKI